MKLTYNWIREFVDIDVPVERVAEALVGAGLEVAAITPFAIPRGVKVARVLSVGKHPQADKLSLCSVDVGDKEPLAIVCGAPNVRAGMLVPCATIGTELAPDFVIKKAKLRGVESFGMLCSEKELGISDDHSGIMDLPADCVVGASLAACVPDDWALELEVTPNRGDCLSVVGVAREVAAALGKPLTLKPIGLKEAGGSVAGHISVTINDAERCPRYLGRLVRGVRIGPSPLWLKARLTAAGMRPINNVVDITNYILVEYGQPMHAFDYRRIGGRRIIVQRAVAGQKFVTLDNVERTLTAEELLICDAERPTALAGIMGGAGSAIADSTDEVFLECAYFDPVGIRKSSKRLGLSTDSSYRFERGVDPHAGLERALDKAAQMMVELAGGSVVSGVVDAYARRLPAKSVVLRPGRATLLLGVAIPADAMERILTALGMRCTAHGADSLTFDVPYYRHDVTMEVDLIEEVGRVHGYDSVPTNEYGRVCLTRNTSTAERKAETLRTALAYAGMHEAVTNSMTSARLRALLTPGIPAVSLRNPLSPDMAEMRTTLAGSLLQTVVHNINRRNLNNRFFELGKTFRSVTGQPLADERWVLGLIIEGNYVSAGWDTQALPVSYYVLKGVIDVLGSQAGLGQAVYTTPGERPPYCEDEYAALSFACGISGTVGKVSATVRKAFDIKTAVYCAELDVTAWLAAGESARRYAPLPKFPALERDFAFVMPEALAGARLVDEMYAASALVEKVGVFDVYRGDNLPAGCKSIAYSVVLRSVDKTLTDQEGEEACRAIRAALKSKYGVELRQ
jgi:phenylalanyl-tRNA synthetase beta chain